MRVELGPVDTDSVQAFTTYGRLVLAGPLGATLPSELTATFAAYLGEWSGPVASGAQGSDRPLRWAHDASCDEVKYLLHGFHRLALEAEAQILAGVLPPLPEPAVLFYRSLVSALLEAVAAESSTCAQWAEELASFWPGIDSAERLLRPIVGSSR